MLFLMKLLFRFCLDFWLPKILDAQASNLEITKKIMAKRQCWQKLLYGCHPHNAGKSSARPHLPNAGKSSARVVTHLMVARDWLGLSPT